MQHEKVFDIYFKYTHRLITQSKMEAAACMLDPDNMS